VKFQSISASNWFSTYLKEDWSVIYINAAYWSIVTMVTLGYGDIIPISTGISNK
jgi:voltage-gated potassium channel Kch